MARNICKIDNCGKFAKGRGFCDKHYQRLYKHGTLELSRNWGNGASHAERFWSRVALTANDDKCWLWQGAPGKNGYGQVTMNYRKQYAHRFSWFLTYGSEPVADLLHSCDTPLCVNPKHLREGNNADNAKDRVERGRTLKGEKSPVSKLTAEDVIEIRKRAAKGEKQSVLVKEFGLCPATVSQIISRQRWGHI